MRRLHYILLWYRPAADYYSLYRRLFLSLRVCFTLHIVVDVTDENGAVVPADDLNAPNQTRVHGITSI